MTFSIKDFFTKCDQIRSFLRIWSHLQLKFLMENFILCAVKDRSRIPATLKKDLFGTVVNEQLDQKYLSFHPPVPPGCFQKMNIFIFSYFLSYSIVLYYTKRFEIMTGATLKRILGSPMPKQSDDSCIQDN